MACAVACCAAEPPAPTFALPGKAAPVRLRIEVTLNGESPNVGWDTFLGRWFEFFDRDASGALSREEAARLGPLPLPGKRELAFDFAALDRDGGGASRAEFADYCRRGGGVATVGTVSPPAADDLRLSALFQQRLDADRDGRYSAAELRSIAAAL